MMVAHRATAWARLAVVVPMMVACALCALALAHDAESRPGRAELESGIDGYLEVRAHAVHQCPGQHGALKVLAQHGCPIRLGQAGPQRLASRVCQSFPAACARVSAVVPCGGSELAASCRLSTGRETVL